MSNQTDDAAHESCEHGDITRHDEKPLWRCPQLGGPVTFEYCRKVNRSLPCVRLAVCWGEQLDVPGFLLDHYDESQRAQIEATAGRGRMDIISETLQRVLSRRVPPEQDGAE
ncbi:MAG: hypothetical protein JXQ73_20380 [Phycisphaerae bacterium]|nr:hypothetical protein [Phycisphaerae bacterium]